VVRRRDNMAFLKPTLISALLAVLLLLAALLLGIFLPQKTPRVVLNQYRAVRSIRDLSLAEHSYALQHPDAGFACDLGELGERGVGPPVGLIDRVLASGTKSSYHFEIGCAQSERKKATTYTITAVPTKPGTTGVYALCTDQTGEIWYSDNGSISDCLTKHKPIEQKYR
jgi:hypothetical protein